MKYTSLEQLQNDYETTDMTVEELAKQINHRPYYAFIYQKLEGYMSDGKAALAAKIWKKRLNY